MFLSVLGMIGIAVIVWLATVGAMHVVGVFQGARG